MDFLANCEDVCIISAIIGALKFELAYESRSGESAHEVLNFINNTNISHTELCTQEAVFSGASPSILM